MQASISKAKEPKPAVAAKANSGPKNKVGQFAGNNFGHDGPQAANLQTFVLQRLCAECGEGEESSPASEIQAKISMGSPDDPSEQEADAVAEHVKRQSAEGSREEDEPPIQAQAPAPVQRLCAECESDQDDTQQVQAKAGPGSRYSTGARMQKTISQPGAGAAVPEHVRRRVEPVLGADLSNVRVHSDSAANHAASSIGARAFTHANHIYLAGAESKNDLGLMAHELTHTRQQGAAGTIRRQNGSGPSANPVLTPDEMFGIVTRERAWEFNPGNRGVCVDPAGVGRGVGAAAGGRRAGSAVFTVIQITDRGGNPVELSYGDHVRYGDPHAEQRAVTALQRRIPPIRDLSGGRMTVVLDQVPCPPGRQNCMGLLQNFARERGLQLEVHLPTRQRMRGSGSVSPRTAAMSSMRTDTPAVRLQRYYPSGSAPAGPGGSPGPSAAGTTGPGSMAATGRGSGMRFTPPPPPSPAAARTRARTLAALGRETRRSIRMSSRVTMISRGVSGLLGILGAISTIRTFQQMHAHGTLFPDAERQADSVSAQGEEIESWALDTTNSISLVEIIASIHDADERSDGEALFDIEDGLDEIYPEFLQKAEDIGRYARSLRARADAMLVMRNYFYKLISVPMGASTAPNAEAFAMYQSLDRLHSTVNTAAQHFETAESQLKFYGDYLESLAYQANSAAWAIFWENLAIAMSEMERQRQLEADIRRERRLNELQTEVEWIDAQLSAPMCLTDARTSALQFRRSMVMMELDSLRMARSGQ